MLQRICGFANGRKPVFWVALVAALACVALAAAFLTKPAAEDSASPLHYKNAAAAAAAVGEMTAIYCPDAQSGSDNVIQIGAASGAELAQYLQQWDWKPCAAPRHALPSPGSVEFMIEEDYRVTVHQRKGASLRRYGEVEYRGERRYYSIGRGDYPDAVALVYAKNEAAAAAPAVQEWFNYLDSPADMPWEGSLEIEIPAFPDLTFRYYPEWIEAGNKSAVKTILSGMPIWNAYFADLSGDGLPEICATATFGSGVIDSRILVHDYMADESYVLEERGEYDYALTLHDGRLLAVQSVYMGESTASGELRLVQRADGTKELRAELRPMEGA